MAGGGFDVVMVKKAGPVQSMTIRGWWINLLLFIILLMGLTLGVGGVVLYRQHAVIMQMVDDTRLLSLRMERLEALSQDQELLAMYAQNKNNAPAASPETTEPPQQEAAKSESETTAPIKTEPAPKEAEQASVATEQEQPKEESVAAPAPQVPSDTAEPQQSDKVAIRNVVQQLEGGDLVVSFDLTKTSPNTESLEGFVMVVMHGKRLDAPWIEAWPPMRLTTLGRPQNYRRGTPFSVQNFRPIRARVAVADKVFDRMEVVVYSREGTVLLVENVPITAKQAQAS